MIYRKTSLNIMFLTLLTGIVMLNAGCEKQDAEEVKPSPTENVLSTTTTTSTSTTASYLWQSYFETDTDLNQWYLESPTTSSIIRSSTVAKYGSYSAKVTLNKTDPDIWSSKRAEMTYAAEKNNPVKSERWYGMSMFLPTSFIADPCEEILMQWKGVSKTSIDGYSMANPPLALMTKNGRWVLNMKHTDVMNHIDLGPYVTNEWTNWVFHIKWSYESDGLL